MTWNSTRRSTTPEPFSTFQQTLDAAQKYGERHDLLHHVTSGRRQTPPDAQMVAEIDGVARLLQDAGQVLALMDEACRWHGADRTRWFNASASDLSPGTMEPRPEV